MQGSYLLGGGSPVIKKYKTAAAFLAGIIVLQPAADATGVSTSTTTSWVNSVGLTMDANISAGAPVLYSTVQGSIEYLQSVIVNPDLVMRALMVGTAADAVLVTSTVGTASSNGLTAVGTTGDPNPSSPTMDEGTVWYISGANGGASRKITGVTTTLTTTVVMPFAANKIGDTYLFTPYSPGNTAGVTMGTNLLNVDCHIAATGATAGVLDLELNGPGNSFLHLLSMDNIFGGNIT
jgi:hypothetical protein